MARTLKDIVQGRLAELDINPFEAARRGGLDRSFVNDILIGRKKSVRGDNATKLAAALGIDISELWQQNSVPVVGQASARGDKVAFGENGRGMGIAAAPKMPTENTVAIGVEGAVLGDHFDDDWLAFYEDRGAPPTPDLFGRLCVVGLASGAVVVKRLEQGQLPNRFNLRSNTEPPIYDAEIKWAARVKLLTPALV